jgi:hypothetical protein
METGMVHQNKVKLYDLVRKAELEVIDTTHSDDAKTPLFLERAAQARLLQAAKTSFIQSFLPVNTEAPCLFS